MRCQKVLLFQNGQKSPFLRDGLFVHLENVSMILTDSYIGGVHLGEMDFFVHLSKMDFAVETHPTFAT